MGYAAGFGVALANSQFTKVPAEAMSRAEAAERGCLYDPYSMTYSCPQAAGYTPIPNKGVMCGGCGAPMEPGSAVCGYCRRIHGS